MARTHKTQGTFLAMLEGLFFGEVGWFSSMGALQIKLLVKHPSTRPIFPFPKSGGRPGFGANA
jgi:hypothetical protein